MEGGGQQYVLLLVCLSHPEGIVSSYQYVSYCNMEVEMYIEWPEEIVDLGIITKEFLGGYCILLLKSMYGNVDAALLWIILLANYLFN